MILDIFKMGYLIYYNRFLLYIRNISVGKGCNYEPMVDILFNTNCSQQGQWKCLGCLSVVALEETLEKSCLRGNLRTTTPGVTKCNI